MIRKGYVDGRWGQVHYRETGTGREAPLVCLHATAYSSRTFVPLMPLLGATRRVIATDTPGYGESDGPPERVALADYASAMADAVTRLVGDTPVDLFGYHTGTFIATEIAAARSLAVARLVLIGIPFFEADEHAAWRAKLVDRRALTEDFDQFAARWDYFIARRTPGLTLERAFACFVDELKAYPRDWWAHDALFDYPAAARLPHVAQPTLVLNPASALAEASRRAARLMPDAAVVEMPALSGAIFDLGTERLASTIEAFLARSR